MIHIDEVNCLFGDRKNKIKYHYKHNYLETSPIDLIIGINQNLKFPKEMNFSRIDCASAE